MKDRVVVITGATGKLGQVVARRFAEDGARLALLARDEESCIGLAASLPGGIQRHRAVPVDLSDAESAVAAADAIRERLGPASVLLHLVGGYFGGTAFVDTTDDDWRGQIELNLMSTIHAVRAFLPDLAAAELGRVVAISTPVAGAPTPGHAAYAATKAAVEALIISVGRDLAGTTATANVLLVRAIGDEKPNQTRPEELAAAMAWLMSPEASAVNGQRIPVLGRT
jgi:NAD(P)-dependent dehydrogenase (short-subunit alcohol dehydrogenase family)